MLKIYNLKAYSIIIDNTKILPYQNAIFLSISDNDNIVNLLARNIIRVEEYKPNIIKPNDDVEYKAIKEVANKLVSKTKRKSKLK